MGLIALREIVGSLVCPRCRTALAAAGDGYRCTNEACGLAGRPFPTRGGQPVLVDFERSVLSEDAVEPATGRAGRVETLPPLLRRWWKPRNEVAAVNIARLLGKVGVASPLVLVVGGGTVGNGVEDLYERPDVRVIGFDISATPFTQLVADAHHIPLADSSVDAVVIQAVLEHVLEPESVVAEIHRVLRARGVVYAETAFMQQVHAGAHDFMRFTGSGHRYLFRSFDELASGAVAGPGTQLLWSVDHVVRGLARSQLAGRVARAAFWWLRLLDRVVPEPLALDDASAVYFLGTPAERPLRPDEIVAYYRGGQ
jgi:SAM-dependent methyltransferase